MDRMNTDNISRTSSRSHTVQAESSPNPSYPHKADTSSPNSHSTTNIPQTGFSSMDTRRRSSSSHRSNTKDIVTAPPAHPTPETALAPFSSRWTDKTPAMAAARGIYLKVMIGGSIMIILIILSILPIYWGALWKTTSNIHKIEAWVVDFDHGALGSAVIAAAQQVHSPSSATWVVKSSDEFPNGPSDLAKAVLDQKVYLALSINPEATSNLQSALTNPSSSYNGSLAATGYGEEARSENGYRAFVRPQLDALMIPTSARFAAQFAKQNLTALSAEQLQSILSNAPQVATQPLHYTMNNLRPFDVPVATAVTFVGLIYLLILSFMVTMISYGAREASGLEHGLRFSSLLRLRMITSVGIYFIISLFYSLLSLAFQVPFNRRFGHAGFVVFWILQWVGMLALGFAMESMITLLTQKGISAFLVLWIICNVSVCFLPIPVLPGIYKFGYATPFYNVGEAVRTIVFGTKNNLGLNFGVLLAWVAVSFTTLPIFMFLMRKKAVNAHNASRSASPVPSQHQERAEKENVA